MALFNVRVYGILSDSRGRILISDEHEHGRSFTKFVGGGLEFGEGTRSGLEREFKEECNLAIRVGEHFYTTDFFVKSAFNDTQVISIFYRVQALAEPEFKVSSDRFDFLPPPTGTDEQLQSFRWVDLLSLDPLEMTFETEQQVVRMLQTAFSEQENGR